jgi:hypothetical protein
MIQMSGRGTVASLAHLGGIATGFLLWLAWKKRATMADGR